ncbi:protein NO VEIN domain-containing protein [Micromonospora sp. CA-263727]|uniref:protein NO VEIN domain-containing protein n=1 Tax=Micromonospora sp. CA-263727 TaxID=3239967 RepID=UPI003D937CDF
MTDHQVRAVLYVARTVDATGSDVTAVARAYAHAVTNGIHRTADLRSAEQALLSAGLLRREAQILMPSTALRDTVALQDEDAVGVLATMLGVIRWQWNEGTNSFTAAEYRSDDERRNEIGSAAEEIVLEGCRSQLRSLGRGDLADQTRRVSLISDSFGFDILAPTIAGPSRQLEVKGQTAPPGPTVRFFISRNEYEVGKRSNRWALVCCAVTATSHDLGWCRAAVLEPYLPLDRNGRWTEAMVTLPRSVLTTGIPDPV